MVDIKCGFQLALLIKFSTPLHKFLFLNSYKEIEVLFKYLDPLPLTIYI